MKYGDKVKIIKSDVARKGEIGTIVNPHGEMTIIGRLIKIHFDSDDTDGLYSVNDFRIIDLPLASEGKGRI